MRLILLLLLTVSTPALADEFIQARCHHRQHRDWRGPRRPRTQAAKALRDADRHNRHHRGHDARVLVVDKEV
jgi:hypothetical protein